MELDTNLIARPVRRALFASLIALGVLAGCGGEADDGGTLGGDVDAAVGGDPTPANACDAVAGQLARSAPLPLDGVYAAVSGDANGIPPDCWSDDNGATVNRSYIALAHGEVRTYRRVFLPSELCGLAAFDTGGRIEELEVGTWTGCGPTYDTADGVFQQFVNVTQLDDGSPLRWHRYMGAGPSAPRWSELIVSSVVSSSAFDELPSDLRFVRYRRPR